MFQKREKLFFSLVFVAVMLATTTLCAAKETVKLGIMLPMTGSMATYGKDLERSTKLGIDEINENGGILEKKIEFIIADSGCDPQQAAMAASMLVSKEVDGIVGGFCSGATLPTLKIFGDANIPYVISVANSSTLIPANPGNAFQMNGTTEHQAEAGVQFFQKLGAKKLALIHQGDGFSKNLAEIAKRKWETMGNDVVAFEMVNQGEQDNSSLVTTMRAKKPDVIYWTAYYGDGATLIKQLRQGGIRSDICVADGSNSYKLIEIAGRASEGVYCTSNPLVDLLPAAKNFIINYEKNYNVSPGMLAGMHYDGVNLMADAIKRAKSTNGNAIIKALSETNQYEGITAQISFKEDNTLVKGNFVILQVKSAKWKMAE